MTSMSLAWTQLRCRALMLLASWFGLPLTLILAVHAGVLPESWFLVGGAVAIIATASAMAWYARFRCPRCSEQMFFNGTYFNIYSSSCLRCGLKIGDRGTEEA